MDAPLLLLQLALVLAFAPVLNGVIKAHKAWWQRRRGPGVMQPWYDLLKYLSRESVVSEHASWVYRWAPQVSFGAHLAAAALVPTVLLRSPLPGVGDAILLVGLFALGRFALALAALDTASNFAGMGTSRELMFAAMVEPVLLLGLFAVAIPAGSTALEALSATAALNAAHTLAFLALFIAAVAETGRIPIDNPDTHLELTMAHEGMLLEYSGRPLALLLWASHLKQLTILSLLAALFAPMGGTLEAAPAALALGLVLYLVKVTVLGLALGVVESLNAKLRIFRVPGLLGAASVLGMLAVTSTYVVGG